MLGAVSSELTPILKLTLIGVGAQEIEIEAEVDTGFSGGLSLQPERIRALGWIFFGDEEVVFGDGREVLMPMYRGIVV
jgi:predicted aspartyl protease